MNSKAKPDISDFKDFREYLSAIYEYRKIVNKKYTYKIWAQELGLSSVSGLTMVLKGQRSPGPSLREKLIKNLNLEKEESSYFEKLVNIAKTAKNDSSMMMLMLDNTQESDLDESKRPLSFKWQMGFLREAVKWTDFKDKESWLESKLRFKIDHQNISHVLRDMKEEGVLNYSDNQLRVNKSFKFNKPKQNYFKSLHKDFLKMAELSYETQLSKRILEYRMIMVKKDEIERAHSRLKELMNQFIEEFDQTEISSKESEVYLTSIYLIPLSK